MITMASRVAQHDLARMLAGAASEASVLASQVSGSEVVSTGIVLPHGTYGRSVPDGGGRIRKVKRHFRF